MGVLGLSDWSPELPVRFSIQLVRSDENGARFVSGVDETNICRRPLIVLNFDDISYFDTVRSNIFVEPRLGKFLVLSAIDFPVPLKPCDIVDSFLKDSNHQNKDQRCDVSEHEAHFEGRDELGNGDQQEEQVKEELELVVEHDRDQRDGVVFRVLDLVRGVALRSGPPVHPNRPFLPILEIFENYLFGDGPAQKAEAAVAPRQFWLLKFSYGDAYFFRYLKMLERFWLTVAMRGTSSSPVL
jgi:hypothetical protein